MELSRFAEVGEDIMSTRSTNYKQEVIEGILEDYKIALGHLRDSDTPTVGVNTLEDKYGITPENFDESSVTVDSVIEQAVTFVRLVNGDTYKESERNTELKGRSMRKIAADVLGDQDRMLDAIEDLKSEHGKTSTAVGVAFEKYRDFDSSVGRQETLGAVGQTVESADTLRKIYTEIDKLPEAGSDTERANIVKNLLESCESGNEVKWVSFCVLGDLSTYMSWKTVASAVAELYALEDDDLYRAKHLTYNDFPTVYCEILEGKVLRDSPEPMVPFAPMLASEAEISEIGDRFVGQPKYDGARILIHSDGEEIRLFTRGLKDVTESIPEITENIEPEFPFIIDGEVVGYDPETGEPFPFEKTMNRLGREKDIEEKRKEIEMKTWLFDCVYYQTDAIDGDSWSLRQDKMFSVVHNCIPDVEKKEWELLAEYIGNDWINTTPSLDDLEEAFELSTHDHEGIIAKDTSASYVFERDEAFTKVKPSTDVTVRVREALQGSGQNANRLGRIIVESAEGTRLGKVGTGFKDEEREKWCPVNGEEDLEGRLVDIEAEEVSITGDEGHEDYSLRFPRFTELRHESEGEVDDLDRILELLN